MAQSDLDVCNLALDVIGANSITSLSDTVREAQVCSRMLPVARRAVLRDNTYNFATLYEPLTAEDPTPTPNPVADFNNIFDLTKLTQTFIAIQAVKWGEASDVQGLRYVERWKVAGNWLGATVGEVIVVYGYDVSDLSTWDPSSYDTLGSYLAYKLSVTLTQSESLQDRLLREYQRARQVSQNRSGMEGTKDRFRTDNRLVGSRQGFASWGRGW